MLAGYQLSFEYPLLCSWNNFSKHYHFAIFSSRFMRNVWQISSNIPPSARWICYATCEASITHKQGVSIFPLLSFSWAIDRRGKMEIIRRLLNKGPRDSIWPQSKPRDVSTFQLRRCAQQWSNILILISFSWNNKIFSSTESTWNWRAPCPQNVSSSPAKMSFYVTRNQKFVKSKHPMKPLHQQFTTHLN